MHELNSNNIEFIGRLEEREQGCPSFLTPWEDSLMCIKIGKAKRGINRSGGRGGRYVGYVHGGGRSRESLGDLGND